MKTVLWTRKNNLLFTPTFRACAGAFYMTNALGWGGLPADVVEYILNMLGWDWFDGVVVPQKGAAARMIEAGMRKLGSARRLGTDARTNDEESSSAEREVEARGVLEGMERRRRSIACAIM